MREWILKVDEPFPLLDEQVKLYSTLGFKVDDDGVDTSEDCYPLVVQTENGLNELFDIMMDCGINRNHGTVIHGNNVTLFYRELD